MFAVRLSLCSCCTSDGQVDGSQPVLEANSHGCILCVIHSLYWLVVNCLCKEEKFKYSII